MRGRERIAQVLDGHLALHAAYLLKYKVRLADGTEEARQICLLDCDRTPRNEKGEYIAMVEDTSILNAKVMIWDG